MGEKKKLACPFLSPLFLTQNSFPRTASCSPFSPPNKQNRRALRPQDGPARAGGRRGRGEAAGRLQAPALARRGAARGRPRAGGGAQGRGALGEACVYPRARGRDGGGGRGRRGKGQGGRRQPLRWEGKRNSAPPIFLCSGTRSFSFAFFRLPLSLCLSLSLSTPSADKSPLLRAC